MSTIVVRAPLSARGKFNYVMMKGELPPKTIDFPIDLHTLDETKRRIVAAVLLLYGRFTDVIEIDGVEDETPAAVFEALEHYMRKKVERLASQVRLSTEAMCEAIASHKRCYQSLSNEELEKAEILLPEMAASYCRAMEEYERILPAIEQAEAEQAAKEEARRKAEAEQAAEAKRLAKEQREHWIRFLGSQRLRKLYEGGYAWKEVYALERARSLYPDFVIVIAQGYEWDEGDDIAPTEESLDLAAEIEGQLGNAKVVHVRGRRDTWEWEEMDQEAILLDIEGVKLLIFP